MTSLKRHLQHADTLPRLWRHARSNPSTLRRFQERKLRYLMAFAYQNVALYRNKFDAAGLRPEQVRSLRDLHQVPRCFKDEMRATEASQLIANGGTVNGLVHRFTTGSTGEPLQIYRTPLEDHLLNQFRLRSNRLLGQRAGDLAAVVLPFPRPGGGVSQWAKHAVKALLPGKQVILEGLRAPESIASDLAALRPDIIRGLPGELAEIAAFWPRYAGGAHKPRMLVTSGEVLSQSLRRTIEEGFNAPARNTYGSHEFNLLAWECPQTGLMHVCDDNVILEVLNDGSPAGEGEAGDVVVTGLHSYVAPYIRYGLGDIAVRGPSPCPCGAPFSTLQTIRGREMDTCITPEGRKIHHWELIPKGFWDMTWHRRYLMIQETPAHIVLQVVASEKPPAADIEQLEKGVLEKLGTGGRFDLQLVDEIAPTESGKYRVCQSKAVGRSGE